MDADLPDQCRELAAPSILNFVISLVIAAGILVSYLPQHAKIIIRRTSKGIAPLFVLLGTVSSTAAFANILTRPETRGYFQCCLPIGPFACFNAFLGVIQVFIQAVCFGLIMILFLMFFPKVAEDAEEEHGLPTWKEALLVLYTSSLFFIVVFVVSVVFEAQHPGHLGGWADFLGAVGTILAIVQYLPQIWTTWKLQNVESLSIPMMCIQTPGSFVWAGSLYARLGPAGWSTWGLFMVTGCLQGCILALGISYVLRDWKKAVAERQAADTAAQTNGSGEQGGESRAWDVDESTPLISNDSRRSQQSV